MELKFRYILENMPYLKLFLIPQTLKINLVKQPLEQFQQLPQVIVTSQFNYLDVFQNATGTITSGQYQRCEIIDTIGITSGVVPGGPFGPV